MIYKKNISILLIPEIVNLIDLKKIMPKLTTILVLVFFLLINIISTFASEPTHYHIDWNRSNSHLLDITMAIATASDEIEVSVPNWRPGRYIIQNYARNVINVVVTDSAGTPLSFEKTDKSTWRIDSHGHSRLRVRYNYYAHQLDGGSSFLDDSELYVNPINCLMYVRGREMEPVTLSVKKPQDWRIAIAAEANSAGLYAFENYHELADTPFIVSPDFERLSFEHKDATIELVLQGEANYDADSLVQDVKLIVAEQVEIMQDLPIQRYVFLYHLVPFAIGHGVEHKNSTSIVLGPVDFSDPEFYLRFLGVTAHEFFHVWNVERIRPQAIYYPDYEVANYTTTMWMYEGITSYYTDITLIRAGLVTQKKLFEHWADRIKSYQKQYGRKIASAAEVSWDSWTKGYGNAPPNTYYSFYTKGALIGLLLDLEIRQRTQNDKSLDDAMRYLNETYAKHNRGVPEDGLQRAVERVTKSDFADFFASYVSGTQEIEYDRYLNNAGLQLEKTHSDKAPEVYLGIRTQAEELHPLEITNVLPESPAFAAGLDIGDVLLAFDGRQVHQRNLNLLLQGYSPGDTMRVSIFRRARMRHFDVVLQEAPPDKYAVSRIDEPDELQNRIRRSWLNEDEEEDAAGDGDREKGK